MRVIKVMPNGDCTLHELEGGYTNTDGYTATDVFFGAKTVLKSRLVSFQFSKGYEFWYDDTGDYFEKKYINELAGDLSGVEFCGPCMIVKQAGGPDDWEIGDNATYTDIITMFQYEAQNMKEDLESFLIESILGDK